MSRQQVTSGAALVAALLSTWLVAGLLDPAAAGATTALVLTAALAVVALLPLRAAPAPLRVTTAPGRTTRGRPARTPGHCTDVVGHPRRPRAPGRA